MNQPTRDEIEEIKKRLERLESQQMEPIKITRLEIDSGSMHKRLDTVQENTAILKIQMEGARAGILQIREYQADLRDRLVEHSKDLTVIKDKQDAHSELLEQLINIGEGTKSDIVEVKAMQAEHIKCFDRLETIMMQILNRLPKAEGE
jgi:predicted  nucleic acid-binding Zn-ribbon protein